MFCILYENRKFLLDLWEEVRAGDPISPFDELNLGLIEYHNGSVPPEFIFVYVDEEEGLCGYVLLKLLESKGKKKDFIWRPEEDIGGWVLEDIQLHVPKNHNKTVHLSRISALKTRFYQALRQMSTQILKLTSTEKILFLSKIASIHDDLKYYGQFKFFKEYLTPKGVVGIFSATRDFSVQVEQEENIQNNHITNLITPYSDNLH